MHLNGGRNLMSFFDVLVLTCPFSISFSFFKNSVVFLFDGSFERGGGLRVKLLK